MEGVEREVLHDKDDVLVHCDAPHPPPLHIHRHLSVSAKKIGSLQKNWYSAKEISIRQKEICIRQKEICIRQKEQMSKYIIVSSTGGSLSVTQLGCYLQTSEGAFTFSSQVISDFVRLNIIISHQVSLYAINLVSTLIDANPGQAFLVALPSF